MTVSKAFEGNFKLIISSSSGLSISHIGSVVLRMQNSLNSIKLNLNNILLIPKIAKNLINISQLTKDNNIVVEFSNKFYFVKDKVKNLIILQGKAEKGLYRLLLVTCDKNCSQNHSTVVKSNFSAAPLFMFFCCLFLSQ